MRKILLVGMCYADRKSLKKELTRLFGAEIFEATGIDEAVSMVNKKNFDLIFVNRICVGDKKTGLELMDCLKKKKISIPIILLTRIEETQKEAMECGAVSSFDMDLIIGYITPSRKQKREKVLEELTSLLK